jgi:23S rRNA (pseudouridine1915-N3)-methyltransferase
VRLLLLSVGRLKAGPERDLAARYEERAAAGARAARLTGFEARTVEESRARRAEDRKAEEARALLALVPPGAVLIALDERGRGLTSEAFAAEIGKARDAGAPAFALALGGPDGHDETLRAAARMTLAFGAMTWPHQLARILAAEQLYRAVTILSGHPYHRA